jgi:hypothetical protein
LYPQLYAGIRDNPALFLSAERDERRRFQQDTISRIDRLIEDTTQELTSEERESVKSRLLAPLFPRIGRSEYGGEWERIWAAEQKVCSSEYFKRFFTYSVPIGDVPDAQVAALCEAVLATADAEKRVLLEAFAARQSLPRLVSRLRQREESLTQPQASALITAIALNGDLFPRERGMTVMVDTRAKAGMLLAGLLRQVPAGEARQQEAERAIRIAMPIGFAMECLRWTRNHHDTAPERRILADGGEAPLEAILTTRIADADAASPLFLQHAKDAPFLYWHWSNGASVTHVGQILQTHFDASPEHVDVFLGCYIGEAWGMESGLPKPADFGREQYDSVSRLVAAEYVAANLRMRYGAELDTPQSYPPDTMPQPRRVAHQYMTVHNYVLQQQHAAEGPTSDTEPDDHVGH